MTIRRGQDDILQERSTTHSYLPLMVVTFVWGLAAAVGAGASPLSGVSPNGAFPSDRALPPNEASLPLAEVRVGMEGYGLTVFQGSRVDTFGVKVLGVQRQVRAAGSLILVEVSGHDLEVSAIPQGMSGSPVFLAGRFAGAVAFGWPGALRPIVGLTPAEEIMALPTHSPPPSVESRDLGVAMPPSLRSLLTPESGSGLAMELFPATGPPVSDHGADLFTARPQTLPAWPEPGALATQLLAPLSPASDLAGQEWLPLPTGYVYRPLGSNAAAIRGSADAQRSGPPGLVPGAACAVPLVLGDAQLGAIGTTTWVADDWVYLLGHPFMQRGPVSLPLAAADIVTVFPSRQMSFKMGSIGSVVGAVHYDLRAGLVGRLGEDPELVPVSVDVQRAESRERYTFQVVKDPFLTPTMVFWCLYSALLVRGDDLSLQTIRYDLQTSWRRAEADGLETIRLTGAVAGPGGALSLAPEWMAPVQILMANRYEFLDLVEVRGELVVTRPMALATIASLDAPQRTRAGQTIEVTVKLQPHRGVPIDLPLQLTVPNHLTAGRYRLVVANARELFALEAERAAARFEDPSLPATLELIRSPRSATELVLLLLAPSDGVVVDGHELATLPGSVARLLQEDASGRVGRTLAGIATSLRRESDYVLQGHVVRDLRLVDRSEPIREDTRP